MTNDSTERSLDPEDWAPIRTLGHRMLDDMFDYLATLRERPVWRPLTAEAKAGIARGLPAQGLGADAVYQDFRSHVLPYALGNVHPRFWGWVTGSGTAMGMLADMLAGGMNAHVAFGEQAATYVETEVVGWFRKLLGFPETGGGLLVSSGSAANLTGLTAARDAIAPETVHQGVDRSRGRLMVYTSEQVHNSVDKVVAVVGIGRENLKRIPTDDQYRIRCDLLEQEIQRDRAQGYRPICIVANAGTVNTGAIDDLPALADIAARHKVWLHVDAAFGAALALSDSFRNLIKGIERADSIAFDLHKWFYAQYDVGCALVRDVATLRQSFSPPASYLADMDRGIASGPYQFGRMGVDLSRSFRALKAWMSLKEQGTERYAQQIEQNIAQASYLAGRITETPGLELSAPVPINVVCFRYVGRQGATVPVDRLNRLNQEILMQLHERGIAAPSFTTLGGRFVIRVAIVNHRSRQEDFDVLLEHVVALGKELE